MLGSYPIATRPLATLASALNVVAADATVTATATTSFDSQTVTVVESDSASVCALATAWDSQTFAQSSAITSATLTTIADANSIANSDFSDVLSATVSLDGSALSGSIFDSAPLLATAFTFNATATADASSSLTAAFVPAAANVLGFDVSSNPGATVSWDGVGRLMSSADASSVLALSPSFDSAFSTVIGSTWSVVINPAVGPVQAPVTPQIFGSGYQLNDLLLIVGGNNDATVSVITRTGTGASGLRLQAGGSGYVSGTYTTQAITGTGSGCVVTLLADTAYVKWKSGATKGSVWAPAPTLTTTGRALSFAAATSATTAAVTADMVSGATAGSVASTVDSAFADWQGIAIGPVPVDLMSYLVSNVSWSGEAIRRLIVAQLRGAASTPVTLKGLPTVIHLRGD